MLFKVNVSQHSALDVVVVVLMVVLIVVGIVVDVVLEVVVIVVVEVVVVVVVVVVVLVVVEEVVVEVVVEVVTVSQLFSSDPFSQSVIPSQRLLRQTNSSALGLYPSSWQKNTLLESVFAHPH